jgi:small conductance mechanosensitive channel
MNQALAKVMTKLQGWMESIIAMLPNIAVALLVVVVFWLVARLARRLVMRVMGRTVEHTVVANFLAVTVAAAVFLIGLVTALGVLQLDKTVTSLLAGAGIVGLAIGLAFQSMASNALAGILISVRKPFLIGQLVEAMDTFGWVERIDLRATVIRTLQGQLVFLPNKEVLEKPILNYSKLGERRVDLDVGISYGDDLERVRNVTLEAVRGVGGRIPEREPDLVFKEFGNSSINFTVRFWIRYRQELDFQHARSDAIMRIKKAYDGAGITIPFPIRTLDFGIKGGKTLVEMFPAGEPRPKA